VAPAAPAAPEAQERQARPAGQEGQEERQQQWQKQVHVKIRQAVAERMHWVQKRHIRLRAQLVAAETLSNIELHGGYRRGGTDSDRQGREGKAATTGRTRHADVHAHTLLHSQKLLPTVVALCTQATTVQQQEEVQTRLAKDCRAAVANLCAADIVTFVGDGHQAASSAGISTASVNILPQVKPSSWVAQQFSRIVYGQRNSTTEIQGRNQAAAQQLLLDYKPSV
jgi:hypothetical protein